jgi:large subunit ribosomal protein L7Ae
MSTAGKKATTPAAKPAAKKAATPAAKPAAKKAAPAVKGGVSKPKTKNAAAKKDRIHHKKRPIFEKRTRNFGVGGDIQHKRDLTRFVKWPKYIRLQRQKSILLKRLKVPGTVNQFARAAPSNVAASLLSFLEKYRPETRQQKNARLLAAAKVDVKAVKGEKVAKPAVVKPKVVKYGLNHVTSLIESKKASLVIIAHDVDPLELVLWLPTLCRKKDVPYIVIKGKARLGKVVHKKTAAVLAITSVHEADKKAFENLVQVARDNFLSRYSELVKATGGQVMGSKHNAAKAKEERAKKAAAK